MNKYQIRRELPEMRAFAKQLGLNKEEEYNIFHGRRFHKMIAARGYGTYSRDLPPYPCSTYFQSILQRIDDKHYRDIMQKRKVNYFWFNFIYNYAKGAGTPVSRLDRRRYGVEHVKEVYRIWRTLVYMHPFSNRLVTKSFIK